MAGGTQDNDEIIAGINVTPLVDIVLVLLIIFMVTASMIVKPSIPIELPEAAAGEETESSTLALTITAEGKVYLNGEEAGDGKIAAFIQAELAAHARQGKKKQMQAIIAADKEVKHGEVIRVIDLVKGLGVTKFAVNIDKPTPK